MNTKITLALTTALIMSSSLYSDDTSDIVKLKQEIQELKEITQSLIDETSSLKTGFDYTTVDTEKSHSGLGNAASKVYYSKSPLSIGGYGEMYYAHTEKDNGDTSSLVDVYRFVPYIGYKFTDNIILNTEIEFEHGGIANDGGTAVGGEVIVEFMYLDFLIHKNVNLRVGNMLIPMGLINERHEPTLFTTVQRPSTSKFIIPSTWHESGVMAYGDIIENLSYKVAFVTALKPEDTGSKWIRNGRGGSFKNKDPKSGIVARVDYTGYNGLLVGLSTYNDSNLNISDVHFDYKSNGARVYGVYTQVSRSDANATQVENANGGYVNVSFDVLSLTSANTQLPVFVQAESVNAQDELGNGNTNDKTTTITIGANYFAHPQVVLKADYAMAKTAGKTDKTVSLSMGFIF